MEGNILNTPPRELLVCYQKEASHRGLRQSDAHAVRYIYNTYNMGRNRPCILTSESRSHTYISYYVVATPRNGGLKPIQLKFDVVRLASETSVYQELD